MMRSTYRTALVLFAAGPRDQCHGGKLGIAAPEWYSSATPTNGRWQQGGKALGEAIATEWKGHGEDYGSPLENVTVECEASGHGTVGPGGADRTRVGRSRAAPSSKPATARNWKK